MCVVSFIGDYGRRNIWPRPLDPNPWRNPTIPWMPSPLNPPEIVPSAPPITIPEGYPNPFPLDKQKLYADMKAYAELLEHAEKVDQVLGQPECPEEDKAIWIAELKERIRQLKQDPDVES